MAFKMPSNVRDTSDSQGDTGSIVVNEDSIAGVEGFAANFADGDETIIVRDDDAGSGPTSREVLRCTWDETNKELDVLGVVTSTNGGSRVNWPAGTRNVFVAPIGESLVGRNNAGQTFDGSGKSIANEEPIAAVTKSSGTLTVQPSLGFIQPVTCDGAFTMVAPTEKGVCLIILTNGATPGAVTKSGFDDERGDADDTTVGNVFEYLVMNDGTRKSLQTTAATDNS